MSFKYFVSEMLKVVAPDRELIKKISIFALLIGIFELTVPFAVQVIINRIYKTYLYEPLFAILIVVTGCLFLFTLLLYIRFNLVEAIQRTVFARVSSNILNYLKDKEDNTYSLKYFEVVSLKKFIAKFLTNGLSLALSLAFGFVILFFYHPFFASLAILVAITYFILLRVYHDRAAKTAIKESSAKYKTASLINESYISGDVSNEDIIHETEHYLSSRNRHFQFLKRHYIVILFIFIVSHLILLGIGGSLVLMGELTIGQLVASELIFTIILNGISKSIEYIEMYYDCYAGLEKLSFIKKYEEHRFDNIVIPKYRRSYLFARISIIILPILLVILPWVQTSEGYGQLTTLRPEERVQDISALVYGRIGKWYVSEGQEVSEGDLIVELVDNDPNYAERLKTDRDAALKKYDAARMAAETALLDFNRQKDLYDQGLSSRLTFEKAKINYHKLIAKEAEAASSLAKKEVSFSRQQRQIITAPSDGVIQQLFSGNSSSIIKKGTKLAVFVPKAKTPAVELYVDGNDIPLIHVGREVRLEFEGFPAFQFSGWPGFSFGTFGGKVASVDSIASKKGRFRVMVVPKEIDAWPNEKILRRGAKTKGWVLMNTVTLGYELWRQFNGFPALPDQMAIEKMQGK